MKVLLINLDRSPERLSQIKQQLDPIGISFERISAIDAKKLQESTTNFVKAPNFEYPYPLTKGEIACFLSHRECWKIAASSNDNWTLILEDHALISPHIKEYIKSTNWIPEECDLIQLIYTELPTFTDKTIKININNNTLLRTVFSSPVGASAYLISKKAAMIAVKHSIFLRSPADNFLFSPWSTFSKHIAVWRLKKALVRRNNVESTITGRNKSTKVLTAYRFSIKRIYKKIQSKIHRLFLKKEKQEWQT